MSRWPAGVWKRVLETVARGPWLLLAVAAAVAAVTAVIGPEPIKQTVYWLADQLRVSLTDIRPPVGLLCVAVACGACGSLVVGNRMAFFSDAMAHTAVAGVTVAVLGMVLFAGVNQSGQLDQYRTVIPLVMAVVGAVVGLTIAIIQEKTSLSSDTVIGVFFALALGFAGLLLPALQEKARIPLEEILFGQLLWLDDFRLLMLLGMAVGTVLIIALGYNGFLLGSFNPSLANSRGIPVRWNNYVFVVLLAVVVNLSVYAVGVLLINALLVVPAAAATNVSRNLRQMFWVTLLGCVACAVVGYRASTSGNDLDFGSVQLSPGPSGAVVVTCVGWFFLSLVVRVVLKRFFGLTPLHDPATCSHDHGDGQYLHRH